MREQRRRELEEARLAEEAKKRENKEQLKKHIKKYKFIYAISIFILAVAVASAFIFLGNPSRYEIYSLENECENQNGDSCMKLAYFYEKKHDTAAVKLYADKAISLLKKRCESDSKVCYQLGMLYEHGDYQTNSFILEKIKNVDYKEAYEYYKISCKLNNTRACDRQKALEDDAKIACEIGISDGCIKLAKDYEQKNDLEHANEIYTKLCNNNNKEACKALASNLLKGNPSEKNIKVAYEIYKKVDASKANTVFNGEHGCLLNNSLACFEMGLEYNSNGDYKKANEYFEMGCNLGDGGSCSHLGVNYQMGNGVLADINKAKEFYQKACDLKDGLTCKSLANLYRLEKNIDSAAINYEKACNLDMAESCGYASELFKDDANSFKDLKKAIEFAKRGCDLKDGKSCFILGARYGEGDGIKKDIKEANKYYQKACDLNNGADGCASLGYNYKYGYGITKDLTLANKYNKKACDAGSGRGCNYLGVNYRDGVGFEKNMQTAYSYFRKSCYDYNYARGCTNLGEILCIYGNYTNAKQEAQDALNKAYYELGDKKALDILNKYFSY
ncbi:tetratricopeptide repeat protein [Campylobacter concisus]|uniref:tetratricopeptide repeat protein n=1 Tax=Campylobacter concisus TaxID=199 RepID=UPI0015E17F8A|nr:SEL1-like repeat protein [Campylobacter concisus]